MRHSSHTEIYYTLSSHGALTFLSWASLCDPSRHNKDWVKRLIGARRFITLLEDEIMCKGFMPLAKRTRLSSVQIETMSAAVYCRGRRQTFPWENVSRQIKWDKRVRYVRVCPFVSVAKLP